MTSVVQTDPIAPVSTATASIPAKGDRGLILKAIAKGIEPKADKLNPEPELEPGTYLVEDTVLVEVKGFIKKSKGFDMVKAVGREDLVALVCRVAGLPESRVQEITRRVEAELKKRPATEYRRGAMEFVGIVKVVDYKII